MSAAYLLQEVARRDVRLCVVSDDRGERLRVDAPPGAVDDALRRDLSIYKSELLRRLRSGADDVIILDIETRSLADLTAVGGRKYAADPSTEVLCVAARMPDGADLVWRAGDPPPTLIFDLATTGVPVVAHNANAFDRFIWDSLGWPSVEWIDTMALAALAGLPVGLDELGEEVLGRRKDARGKALTLGMSRPGPDGRLRPVPPEELEAVVGYCRSDVALLAGVWTRRLSSVRDVELVIRAANDVINGRGFHFDVELAHALADCDEVAGEETENAQAIELVVRSRDKLVAALAVHGAAVPDIKKKTLTRLLGDDSLSAGARELIRARLAWSGITRHKLRAALARVADDGRLRDSLVYHGSHTGRWTGRGFQPQNLPRGVRKLDVEAALEAVLARDHVRLRQLARSLGVSVHDVLASLVRSCVRAGREGVLLVADYAAIEPRALAWFVGDRARLTVLRNGGDLYRLMAVRLYGVDYSSVTKQQRDAGKPPVLGCGYQMGAARFGRYAEDLGLDWAKMPMTPSEVVEMWRDDNPLVAGVRDGARGPRRGGVWQVIEDAAVRACLGERVSVGCTTWERHGEDVACLLPSGRTMVYRRALVERVPTPWGSWRDGMTYLHCGQAGRQRVVTYGGLLTENVIQAICRDVLVDAILRLEAAGFAIVLHVHDEIIVEADDEARFEQMKQIMREAPAWAAGLPLDVDGYVSVRYRGK